MPVSFWVYILKSESTGNIYIGHTSDLQRRVREHNDMMLGKQRYTRKQKGPWCLVYSEEYQTRAKAMERERALKSGRGRQWIFDHILTPQLNPQGPPKAD
ncbi:MAG: GIY-YIG nuclease family protein [Thermodesulfobacteriota bacterium]|nr:GIY-YIG nuclease family protein [Thermodesulfobacteriota bacterium]